MGASYRLRVASDGSAPLAAAPPSAPAAAVLGRPGREGRGARPAASPPARRAAADPDADPGDPTAPLRGVLIAALLAMPFWLGVAFWLLRRVG